MKSGINSNNKQKWIHLNLDSASRSAAQSEEILIPIFSSLPTISEDVKEISTSDEGQYLQLDSDSDFEADLGRFQRVNQQELNDLLET